MITVYYLTCDCGDGSSTVYFFRDRKLCERLINEKEEYYMNDIVNSFCVPDLGTIKFSDEFYEG